VQRSPKPRFGIAGSNPVTPAKFMKKIVYIDMDGVVADFDKAFPLIAEKTWIKGQEKKVPLGFFENLEPIKDAIDAVKHIAQFYEVHFLSTPQWSNPDCWKEKRIWIGNQFGELMRKRLTLTHHKRLLKGDYLIDDNIHEGFEGKHIHFGTKDFPTWKSVVSFLEAEFIKDWENQMAEKFTQDIRTWVDSAIRIHTR
jgi:5'-nucleotidase